jgi:carbon starvation protein CstA
VAAPITSGDTALRSARLITADFLHFPQNTIPKRLAVSVPIFAISAVLMLIDFAVLWRYFGWFNQTLSIFTLWAITAYLYRNGRRYIITLIPAIFMTSVCSTYILLAPEGFSLPAAWGYSIGLVFTVVLSFIAIRYITKKEKSIN